MRCALPGGVEVRVEVCRRHGVWFDEDDLVIVARAVAKALGKPVPEAVESLARAHGSPGSATTASSPSAPEPAWNPRPTGSGDERSANLPRSMSVTERAGHTAIEAVGVGVDVVGEVASAAVGVVTAPVRLSLAVVEGLVELFD